MKIFEDTEYAKRGLTREEIYPVMVNEGLHTALIENRKNFDIAASAIEYVFYHFKHMCFTLNLTEISQCRQMPDNINMFLCVNYLQSGTDISAEINIDSIAYDDTNKIKFVTFDIDIPEKLTYLNVDLLKELIHHEVTHFIHHMREYSKTNRSLYSHIEDYINYRKLVDELKLKISHGVSRDELLIELILYRLFVKTETNAFISQTCSALESVNAKHRSNYSKDFCKTGLYKKYAELRGDVEKLNNADDSVFEYAHSFFNDKRISNMSEQSFRNWFIKQAKSRLDYVWRKMAAAAMSYYIHDDFNNDILKPKEVDILKNLKDTSIYNYLSDDNDKSKYIEHVVTIYPFSKNEKLVDKIKIYVYVNDSKHKKYVTTKRIERKQ